MSKTKALYPHSSPQYSAERMGLYKLDMLINIMINLLQKMDESTSLGSDDYSTLLNELIELQDSIRTVPNNVK